MPSSSATRSALAAALLTASLLAAPAPARASSVDLFGFGARGQAMAGSVVSTATGFESAYYNPAGVAFDERPSAALGYQVGAFDLTLQGSDQDTRSAPLLTIGFGVPIPFGGALEDRISLALGFVIPQSSILIADIARPGDASFPLVANRAQTVSVMGVLAVRVTDWLAVGAGALALAELQGEITVSPNDAGTLGTTVRDELIADYSPIVGLLARPTDWLSIGLTWRGRSSADFSLPLTADLGERFGIPLPVLDITGTAQYDPPEVALEVSAKPLPWLLLAAGAVWQGWSDFPQPIRYTAVPEGTPPQPLPNFHDTVSVRLGAEATLTLAEDLALVPRLGFSWEPSPVPEQKGFQNYVDGDRAVIGLGASLRYGPARLDLVGQVHSMATARSDKDPALVADPEANPGFPTLTGSGTIWFGGVELGVTL